MSGQAKGRRVVGIDLGTTHTVVAWTDPEASLEPQLFEIPQLVAAAEVSESRLLPSTLYAPPPSEQLSDPLGEPPWVVGAYARRRGGEVPGRAVSSAKSWLSHGAVDRTASILPWRGPEETGDEEDDGGLPRGKKAEEPAPDVVPRLSPVAASALLLQHVRRAWDQAHPRHPLAEQQVVLTVPASFDAVARQLTVQAAAQAGLDVRLLEEPQAAFYDFMHRGGEQALEQSLPAGTGCCTVLVCDIGGGTTDLSLIRATRGGDDAPFEVERVAVGRHLLLGGDNMDLALAHLCERRLVKEGEQLDPQRFAQLVFACRTAKERLLADATLGELPISLAGRGSKLVGGTMRTTLGRDEVEQTVLDGFFPEVELGDRRPVRRAGIVAFGLPYERDVAITRHLAAFVSRHLEAATPNALLFNGGVFRAEAIAGRLGAIAARWLEGQLQELPTVDPETTVARGAVAYGLALLGLGTRIGGGAAQGFYVGLGSDSRDASPRAMCVLPRGAQEGKTLRAEARTLELTVGRPVRFDLYAAESGAVDPIGAVVALDDERFERLPPVVATLPGAAERGAERVPVVVEAELSAIGTLELGCVEAQATSPRRFALAFELRAAAESGAGKPSMRPAAGGRRDPKFGYGKRFDEAREAVEMVFGKGRQDVQPREVKGLLRTLERHLGPRASWTMALDRGLYDLLRRHHKARRRSPDHERLYWLLAGFCLRPGFGDPRDEERVAAFAKLFEQRLSHGAETRAWAQFWIAWRRVAAGLPEKRQVRFRDIVDPFLAPADKNLKTPKAFRNEALADMLDLAASLERVPAPRRRELGGWVLERTWTDRDPRLWAALGRIGARVPTYGSVHQVVPARAIERWMDHLLRERWEEIPTASRAAMTMCRLTDDRARDVSAKLREQVVARLDEVGAPEQWARAVREFVPPTHEEQVAFYGEDLPVGLRLVD